MDLNILLLLFILSVAAWNYCCSSTNTTNPSYCFIHQTPHHKKGEYDIWAMKMEHYLSHTDYPIWQVIQKRNGPESVTTDTNRIIKVLPPKTAEEVMARERERKAKTTLLMALLEDHLAKFHKMADAKEMQEAIKSRFGYDRFQTLLSQLEIHGASVSHEDANQMFLRSLPSSWSQVALIIRTKPGLDTLSFDDLYNNLRVFKRDVKGSTVSSLNTQNMSFMSTKNTSSTNDINDDDIKEMDLKWQMVVISIRIKKFHKRTGRKAKGNQDSRRRDVGYNGNKTRDNGRRPAYQDDSKLWLPLMERILTGLDMLKKMLRTML
uniref:Ribonuclease H-like domain-containing protein n=1 Tax=Tanacetum cinerariifolium TaxID=118510 RepID=A0A6L2KTN8_TANCI|nr:ribonuclease H-like domain-containing protein [Tanacetum cinerariifolium]